jgi:hypothetical protein
MARAAISTASCSGWDGVADAATSFDLHAARVATRWAKARRQPKVRDRGERDGAADA